VNQQKFLNFTILGGMFFLVVACTTAPSVPVPAGAPVLIQTKAQIRNDDQTNNINIEIALLPQKAVRLEITAALGISVASVLMTPQQITYALHSSKQYVVGPFHAKTLYPVFKKNIDPELLWKVIHDQSPASNNFKCELNAAAKPIKCIGLEGEVIKWTYEEAPRKRIDIISNRFEMNWIFKEESALKVNQAETFVLKKPADYKEIIIK
jgi:hypothetical protein